MIQINLLPVREAKRKADVKQNVLELVLVLIVVVAVIGFVHSDLTEKIETTENRITQMQNDIDKFKPQLDQVAAFRAKKAELQKKIDVIAGLDRARKGPVRLMDELATHTPDRLWLDSVSAKGTTIELTGQSLDNELVAVFLGSLGDSPYFTNVDLNSTELANGPEGLKVVKFKIQAQLSAPPQNSEPAPGAAPAQPPAPAATKQG
ncbi:MAG TPA: PilN domain-containing protein [Myxococcota bacterium]|nr:PilN domain-containing protein [Myxococcota bacterium]